ncbi:MAG: phosphate starvation-inducible protein PhoH, partial [Lachnospiraceae bacterium]|nr:phosphate starvation-inducible protein PhoH [Lachnospiraceae bacterium]
MAVTETLIEIPAESQSEIFGRYDQYIKKIEKTLHVTVISRDSAIKLVGELGLVKKAAAVLKDLYELSRKNEVTEQ